MREDEEGEIAIDDADVDGDYCIGRENMGRGFRCVLRPGELQLYEYPGHPYRRLCSVGGRKPDQTG